MLLSIIVGVVAALTTVLRFSRSLDTNPERRGRAAEPLEGADFARSEDAAHVAGAPKGRNGEALAWRLAANGALPAGPLPDYGRDVEGAVLVALADGMASWRDGDRIMLAVPQ